MFQVEDELELGVAAEKEQRFLNMKPFIHLRLEDAKWSNDDPVTANDFVYAWQQVASLNQDQDSSEALFFDVIKMLRKLLRRRDIEYSWG